MATRQEVESFLYEFKAKMKIWDVLFRSDRDSNIQALADLDIRPIDRKKFLKNLNQQIIQKDHWKKSYMAAAICGYSERILISSRYILNYNGFLLIGRLFAYPFIKQSLR